MNTLDALAAILRGESGIAPAGVTGDLVDAAEAHGVDALVARAALAWPVAAGVSDRLKAILAGHEALSAARDREMTRILAGLAAGAVSPIVIKGAHLAQTIYPCPALRPRSDTDLFIAEDDQSAAASLLHAIGYTRPVHVRGTLILGQIHFHRTDDLGVTHALDVHWRLAAPLLFRGVLPAAELRASRVPIPALGPHAWGPAAAHALLIACVHLVAHHRHDPRLLWLLDIARLAESLDDRGVECFLDIARRAGIAAICATALGGARRLFDGPALSALAARAGSLAAARSEPSARLLAASRPIDELWLDLGAAAGSRERAVLLREHLWPDAAYMRATTAPTGWLPLAYARRALFGMRRWMSSGARH